MIAEAQVAPRAQSLVGAHGKQLCWLLDLHGLPQEPFLQMDAADPTAAAELSFGDLAAITPKWQGGVPIRKADGEFADEKIEAVAGVCYNGFEFLGVRAYDAATTLHGPAWRIVGAEIRHWGLAQAKRLKAESYSPIPKRGPPNLGWL